MLRWMQIRLCRCSIPQIWSCRWAPQLLPNTFGCTYSCYWSAEVVSHSWWAVWSLVFSPSAWILRAGIFSVYAGARSSPCSQCGPYKSSRMEERAWVCAAAANMRLSSEKLIPSSLMETGAALRAILLSLRWLDLFSFKLMSVCWRRADPRYRHQKSKGDLAQNLPWPRAEGASLVCDTVGLHASSKHTKWVQVGFLRVTSRCQVLWFQCTRVYEENPKKWVQSLNWINAPVQAEISSTFPLVRYCWCLIHMRFTHLLLLASVR